MRISLKGYQRNSSMFTSYDHAKHQPHEDQSYYWFHVYHCTLEYQKPYGYLDPWAQTIRPLIMLFYPLALMCYRAKVAGRLCESGQAMEAWTAKNLRMPSWHPRNDRSTCRSSKPPFKGQTEIIQKYINGPKKLVHVHGEIPEENKRCVKHRWMSISYWSSALSLL